MPSALASSSTDGGNGESGIHIDIGVFGQFRNSDIESSLIIILKVEGDVYDFSMLYLFMFFYAKIEEMHIIRRDVPNRLDGTTNFRKVIIKHNKR